MNVKFTGLLNKCGVIEYKDKKDGKQKSFAQCVVTSDEGDYLELFTDNKFAELHANDSRKAGTIEIEITGRRGRPNISVVGFEAE